MTRDELGRLLERLQAPVLPPKLQSLSARYRFKLDGGETWDILLDHGHLSLVNPSGAAETLVECSEAECMAIFTGRHNLLTAFMRGDARIKGTISAAKNLYSFLQYAQLEEAKA
jgi:putative sterol carrier protein